MSIKKFLYCLAFVLAFFMTSLANEPKAKDPKQFYKKVIGKYGEWTVLETNPNNKQTCYAVLYGDKRTGNNTEKMQKKPYLMVNFVENKKARVAIYFGYTLLEDGTVNLSIDGKQFKLISYKDVAISQNYQTDLLIIDAIKTGKVMRVRAENGLGNYTVDEYDLSGFTSVYKTFEERC